MPSAREDSSTQAERKSWGPHRKRKTILPKAKVVNRLRDVGFEKLIEGRGGHQKSGDRAEDRSCHATEGAGLYDVMFADDMKLMEEHMTPKRMLPLYEAIVRANEGRQRKKSRAERAVYQGRDEELTSDDY